MATPILLWAPRVNYILRTVPPSLCVTYARERDAVIEAALSNLLNITTDILNLPKVLPQLYFSARRGGLGFHSASDTSPAAYWASWADTLSTLQGRFPGFTDTFRMHTVQAALDRHIYAPHSALINVHDSALLLQ